MVARPLGELVLAYPYRNRPLRDPVSVPPEVLAHARQHGATRWLVRHDMSGECFALPLSEVERVGSYEFCDGRLEWAVPLSAFARVAWQHWDFVPADETVQVEASDRSDPAVLRRLHPPRSGQVERKRQQPKVRQMDLFGSGEGEEVAS